MRTTNEAQTITNFTDANNYLRQFHDIANTKYDLKNIRQLTKYLGNPQDKLKVIHVAGTSGKTSTSYYIAALLIATGKTIGLTVSPIVDEINERIQINLKPLDEASFCKALDSFSKLIAKAPVKPSWFELMIALSFWYFAKEKVDYAIIEVGMGGLKDATNVIDRQDKVCVITDIGYDHTKSLGGTLDKIAIQKAGIIQKHNAVFSYRQNEIVDKVLTDKANQEDAKLSLINPETNPYTMPDYQFRNWHLALVVFNYLVQTDGLTRPSDEQLNNTRDITIPGRMDKVLYKGKTIIMDGAHNAQKIAAFIDSFTKLYPEIKPAILVAMRSNKDYREIAKLLTPMASQVITTTFTANQDLPISSMPAEQLAEAFKNRVKTTIIPNQKEALTRLLNSPESVVIITGSIYLLGQLRNAFPGILRSS